jgi:hypothetical protein
MKTRSISPRGVLMSCLGLLWAAGTPFACADDASRAARIAELMRLTGVAQGLAESRLAGQAAARKTIESISEQMIAKFPDIPPRERTQIENAAKQFLRDVDKSFDQDEAVRTWGRLYSQNLTDADLDAILAFYRSPVGQKDIGAASAALPQFQHYMVGKYTAARNAAVANYTAALRSIVDSSTADGTTARGAAKTDGFTAGAGSTPRATADPAAPVVAIAPRAAAEPAASVAANAGAATMSVGSSAIPADSPARPWDSNPTAPDGQVIPNPPSYERCEMTPPTPGGAHAAPPSGRSIVCVCIDAQGTLTRNPVIAESSGDSRVDSGAVKMARSDSGRYKPPILDGQPQRACFRFAIDFRHQQ